jgi:hypothetical protein
MLKARRFPLVLLATRFATRSLCSPSRAIANALYQKAADGKVWTNDEICEFDAKIRADPSFNDPADLSKSLFGLMHVKGVTKCELKLIETLRRKLATTPLNARQLCMSLYGLQSLMVRNTPTNKLVEAIDTQLRTVNEELDLTSVLMAFRGTTNMRCSAYSVRKLLDTLHRMLRHQLVNNHVTLSTIDVFGILCAFRGKSSGNAPVRMLAGALAEVLEGVDMKTTELSVDERRLVLVAVGSMDELSSYSPEVRSLVLQCNRALKSSDAHVFTIPEVLGAIKGLGQLDTTHKEVRVLVKTLSQLLDSAKQEAVKSPANAKAYFGNSKSSSKSQVQSGGEAGRPWGDKYGEAFYGMRNLHCSSQETRDLLWNVLKTLQEEGQFISHKGKRMRRRSEGTGFEGVQEGLVGNPAAGLEMSLSMCAKAINGLQNMSSDREVVRHAVGVLAQCLWEKGAAASGSEEGSEEGHSDEQMEVLTMDDIERIGRGLRGLDTKHEETRNLLRSFGKRLETLSHRRKAIKNESPREEGEDASSSIAHDGRDNAIAGNAISAVLNGLGNCVSEANVVRRVLFYLHDNMRQRLEGRGNYGAPLVHLTAPQMSRALRGMRQLNTKDYTVRMMLEGLRLCHLETGAPAPAPAPVAHEETSKTPPASNSVKWINSRTGDSSGGSGTTTWEPDDVCYALSGLRRMDASSAEVKQLLVFIGDQMNQIFERNRAAMRRRSSSDGEGGGEGLKEFTVFPIGEAAAGLRSMDALHQEPRDIVKHLARAIRYTKGSQWSVHDVAKVMSGVSSMSSDYLAVRILMQELAIKLREIELGEQKATLGKKVEPYVQMFYGCCNLDSEHADVVVLLDALIPHLATSLPGLPTYFLGTTLTGLRGISNVHVAAYPAQTGAPAQEKEDVKEDEQEVDLEETLEKEVKGSEDVARGVEVVHELLRVLTIAVQTCQGDLSAENFSIALRGMQRLESGAVGEATYCEPVVQLAEALTDRMTEEIDRDMTLEGCYKGLWGLINISTGASHKVDVLRQCLITKAMSRLRELQSIEQGSSSSSKMQSRVTPDNKAPDNKESWEHSWELDDSTEQSDIKKGRASNLPLMHMQRVSNCYLSSPRHSNAMLTPLMTTASQLALQELATREAVGSSGSGKVYDSSPGSGGTGISLLEWKFVRELEQAVISRYDGSGAVRVERGVNEMLGGFESDLVLRVYATGDTEKLLFTYNIEIDGPNHLSALKRNFASSRDAYLESEYAMSTIGQGAPIYVTRVAVQTSTRSGRDVIVNRQKRDQIVQRRMKVFAKLIDEKLLS